MKRIRTKRCTAGVPVGTLKTKWNLLMAVIGLCLGAFPCLAESPSLDLAGDFYFHLEHLTALAGQSSFRVQAEAPADENIAPIAVAGLSRYAGFNAITLDGSGSYDPDNTGALTYAWRQVAGPVVAISGQDTPTPTVGGFVQTNEVQECLFELVVSDGKLSSVPDTVQVIIVPNWGNDKLALVNPPFRTDQPTVIYFGGGDCISGGGSWPPYLAVDNGWLIKANIIIFTTYTPDVTYDEWRTYYHLGDRIIAYLSAKAPDYQQPIQTIGWSTGGQPAIDAAIRMNRVYHDSRYNVNHVTHLDAPCRALYQSMALYKKVLDLYLTSAVDGETCWIDHYNGSAFLFPEVPHDALFIKSSLVHADVMGWYFNSLSEPDMNNFNHGIVGGAYWSVVGPGKNLQLARGTDGYNFYWNGSVTSGTMLMNDESKYPGRLPQPVTLRGPSDNSLADPGGVILSCDESENAVRYQLLFGPDPRHVDSLVSETAAPPDQVITVFPFKKTWWTVKVRDPYGSTIYADPICINASRFTDLNGDHKVDLKDYGQLASQWMNQCQGDDFCQGADLDGKGEVGLNDLVLLVNDWLAGTGFSRPQFPDPLAHWTFDGDFADSFGNHDGIGEGNPVFVTGDPRVGSGAIKLDGDDRVKMTGFKGVSGALSRTCTAWIKTTEPTGEMMWWGNNTTTGGMWRLCIVDGVLTVRVNGGNIMGSSKINTGKWVHIAAVLPLDGNNTDDILLFVNGKPDPISGTVPCAINTAGEGDFRVGADDSGHYWIGQIDDVRVYQRELTRKQVVQLAEALVAYAGADQSVTQRVGEPAIATLAGEVFGASSNRIVEWSKLEGPGEVNFDDPHQLGTGAEFSKSGTYVLRLTVTDQGKIDTDDISIRVYGEVARWTFDGDYTDRIRGYDGTAQGDPVLVGADQARVGNGAVELDGNDFVMVQGYMGIAGSQARTCTAWIKTTGTIAPIVYWGDKNTAGGFWDIRVNGQGLLRVQVGGGPGINGTSKVNTGQWVHVAVVLPEGGQAGNVALYVNGVLETGVFTPGYINSITSAAMRIGANETGNFFTGLIDDVRVYDRALTAEEIAPLANP